MCAKPGKAKPRDFVCLRNDRDHFEKINRGRLSCMLSSSASIAEEGGFEARAWPEGKQEWEEYCEGENAGSVTEGNVLDLLTRVDIDKSEEEERRWYW